MIVGTGWILLKMMSNGGVLKCNNEPPGSLKANSLV